MFKRPAWFRSGKSHAGLFVLVLLVLLVFPGHAWPANFEFTGVRPLAPYGVFSAFSAQSPPRNAVSFGLNVEVARTPDSIKYIMGAAYGVTNRVEVMLTLPYVDGFQDTSGLEDFALAGKYRFLDEGRYGPSAALLVTGFADTGKDRLSMGGGAGAGVILSKKLGPFMGHLNAILLSPQKSHLNSEWDFLGALEFPAANNMKLLAEYELRKGPYGGGIDLSELRLGYRLFNDNFFSTIGAGVNFADNTPDYRLFISLSTLFPNRGNPSH